MGDRFHDVLIISCTRILLQSLWFRSVKTLGEGFNRNSPLFSRNSHGTKKLQLQFTKLQMTRIQMDTSNQINIKCKEKNLILNFF